MNEQQTTKIVIDTLNHVKKFSGETILIKLGGSILHDKHLIKTLCMDLTLLRAAGIKIIIVHGGSKAINAALKQYQINSTFLEGLRVTSKEAMDVIEMVLCGHINQILVREINALGVHAAGLSGADNQLLQCDYYSQEHGYVGNITAINADFIQSFLHSQEGNFGTIPIIAPVGVDEVGHALNINADWAASAIAGALGIEKLIYLTDQDGIKDQVGQVVSQLTTMTLQNFIDNGVVENGMLTKTKTILSALDMGIHAVHVLNGSTPHALLTELFTTQGLGTICKPVNDEVLA